MKEKLNFILDLDQTIISAEADDEYDFEKNEKKAKKFTFHDMDGFYIIFERPNVQKFLDYIFKHYNVSVWTAASKDYALFIIDKVILRNDPERKLDYIMFSYHCDISQKLTGDTKNLSIWKEKFNIPGYNSTNTVILDDYDEVFKTQPNNCIKAEPFEFTKKGSEHCDFLSKLIRVLEKVDKSKDTFVNKINKIMNVKQ